MRKARIGLGIVLALLVVLGGQAGVQAQTAPGPGAATTVTGVFAMISGDPQVPGAHRYVFTVTDDDGTEYRLNVSDEVGAAAGGVTNLTGKRVSVAGTIMSSSGGGPAIAASSITVQASAAGGPEATPQALAGAQPFVNILCRFSDATGVTPVTSAYVSGLVGDSYPGISHFWRENSYNAINNVGSVVLGWYNLPQPRSYYVPGGNLDFGRAARDCTARADASVNFNNYKGINLLFNQNLDCCAWGGGQTLTLDGTTKVWAMTWMPPWGYQNQRILGHEMGHAYGLPHSSGNYGAVYDSRWDVMSNGGSSGPVHATYGQLGTHTIGYHKDKLNWIPAARKYTAFANTCKEIAIDHLAQVPATSGTYLLANIPVAAGKWYTVEARKHKGYDSGRIPGEAIVIHFVDTSRKEPAHVMDATNDNNPNDAGAMWVPGETFNDAVNTVKVEVRSATTNGWVVRITKGSATCPTPPPAPTLISPVGTGNANPITYTWNSAAGATWYRLYVNGPGGVREQWFTASNAGCASGGVCKVTPTGNAENNVPWQLANGNYTWWALGWSSAGYGPWSAGKNFTVGPPAAPVLISPSGTAAPNPVTYRWYASKGATWYRLYINGPGGVRAQWFTATQTGCSSGTGTCQMTPTGNAEGGVPWQLTSGSYNWWALGWNAQGAGPWSAPKSFTGVFGFDSQFNANAANWVSRSGLWNHVSGAFLTSTGAGTGRWASAYYGNVTFSNFVYEARLWRNGSSSSNQIILRGNPGSLTTDNAWTNQYVFQYSRNGTYSIWKTVNGTWTAIRNWTSSSAIAQGSTWNLLRVTANGSSFAFSINGTTVWQFTDTSFSVGYAGVGFYVDSTSGNQLWVDYAKLTALPTATPETSAPQAADPGPASGDSTGPSAPSGTSGAQTAPAVSPDDPGTPIASSDAPSASPPVGPATVAPPV